MEQGESWAWKEGEELVPEEEERVPDGWKWAVIVMQASFDFFLGIHFPHHLVNSYQIWIMKLVPYLLSKHWGHTSVVENTIKL